MTYYKRWNLNPRKTAVNEFTKHLFRAYKAGSQYDKIELEQTFPQYFVKDTH